MFSSPKINFVYYQDLITGYKILTLPIYSSLCRFSSFYIHHHFRQSLSVCLLLLVKRLTASTCQAQSTICQASTKSVPISCQASTKSVPIICQASTKSVPIICQASTKSVPIICQASTKSVPSICQASTKGVPSICQASTMGVPSICQASTKSVPSSLDYGTNLRCLSVCCYYEQKEFWLKCPLKLVKIRTCLTVDWYLLDS